MMGMCALAASRVRDGAYRSQGKVPDTLARVSSESFFAASKDAIPKDLIRAHGLDFIRACALLAFVSMQNEQIRLMQYFIERSH